MGDEGMQQERRPWDDGAVVAWAQGPGAAQSGHGGSKTNCPQANHSMATVHPWWWHIKDMLEPRGQVPEQ